MSKVEDIAHDIGQGAKNIGKDLEGAGRAVRDAVTSDKVTDKLKAIENDARSLRDNVSEDLKKTSNVDDAINKFEECRKNEYHNLSAEEYDKNSDKYAASIETIKGAPEHSTITIAGDCTVTIESAHHEF